MGEKVLDMVWWATPSGDLSLLVPTGTGVFYSSEPAAHARVAAGLATIIIIRFYSFALDGQLCSFSLLPPVA